MCKDRNTTGHCRPLVDDPDDADYDDDDDYDLDDVVYEVAGGEHSDEELDGGEPKHTADDLAGIRQRATMVSLVKKAQDIVTGARNKCYGNPYDNHNCSAALWNDYLHRRGLLPPDKNLTAEDHCWMMGALLKASRQAHWSQEDNALDCIGYALNAWACHVEEEFRKTPEYLQQSRQ